MNSSAPVVSSPLRSTELSICRQLFGGTSSLLKPRFGGVLFALNLSEFASPRHVYLYPECTESRFSTTVLFIFLSFSHFAWKWFTMCNKTASEYIVISISTIYMKMGFKSNSQPFSCAIKATIKCSYSLLLVFF